MGLLASFWVVVGLLAVWATAFAAMVPVRQAFLNGLIPSAQRATVLSSDNLLSSAGGVVAQPGLGKVADVWSYGTSYLVSAGVQLLALPFIVLARREQAPSDHTNDDPTPVPVPAPASGPEPSPTPTPDERPLECTPR
jgi:MFS family permease